MWAHSRRSRERASQLRTSARALEQSGGDCSASSSASSSASARATSAHAVARDVLRSVHASAAPSASAEPSARAAEAKRRCARMTSAIVGLRRGRRGASQSATRQGDGCGKIGQPERIVRRFDFVEGARKVAPAHAAAADRVGRACIERASIAARCAIVRGQCARDRAATAVSAQRKERSRPRAGEASIKKLRFRSPC